MGSINMPVCVVGGGVKVGIKVIKVPVVDVGTCNVPVGVGVIRVVRVKGIRVRHIGMIGVIVVKVGKVGMGHVDVV
jgi:hypothetical protein